MATFIPASSVKINALVSIKRSSSRIVGFRFPAVFVSGFFFAVSLRFMSHSCPVMTDVSKTSFLSNR